MGIYGVFFLGGSDGKESPCSAGDPGSIPGLGRSTGEGNANPLQYYCWENPMDRGAWQFTVHEVAESDMTEGLHFTCKSPDYSSILIHHLHPVDKADVWLIISMIITVKQLQY